MPATRDRPTRELPPAVTAFLAGADPRTVDQLVRDVAAHVVARLMAFGGEPAHNPVRHGLLLRDPSPGVRAIAATLGCDPAARDWTRARVVAAVCSYFGLDGPGVRRDIARRAAALTP